MTGHQLASISAEELQSIADRITVLRQWYNGHPHVTPCEFNGDPCDLSTLTFISYELDRLWEWDAGETLSCTLGNVFVQRFAFQWVQEVEDPSLRRLAVHNPQLAYTIFPWQRLNENFASFGYSHSAAEDILVSILSDLHSRNAIPRGWHPVLDALNGDPGDIPKDIIGQIRTLRSREPNWFRLLGLFPYEWNKTVSWETVSLYLSAMLNSEKTNRRD